MMSDVEGVRDVRRETVRSSPENKITSGKGPTLLISKSGFHYLSAYYVPRGPTRPHARPFYSNTIATNRTDRKYQPVEGVEEIGVAARVLKDESRLSHPRPGCPFRLRSPGGDAEFVPLTLTVPS
jgi:hypothetical protein